MLRAGIVALAQHTQRFSDISAAEGLEADLALGDTFDKFVTFSKDRKSGQKMWDESKPITLPTNPKGGQKEAPHGDH